MKVDHFCKRPDRDVPKLLCGHPLPCLHHTVVIDLTKKEMVPFTKKAVKEHLDKCIKFWRDRSLDPNDNQAVLYIDAYQSMRTSLFGETLK